MPHTVNFRDYNDDFVAKVLKEVKKGKFIELVAEQNKISLPTLIKWAGHIKLAYTRGPRKARHDWDKIKSIVG